MQKSPLPTLPGQRAPALAQDAGTGTPAHSLCTCRLHLAAGTSPARLAEQAADLQPALSCQRRDLACDRSRSPASWGRDRLLQRAPQLESALAVSSPCPLRTGRRWSGAGSLPLDLRPALLLSAHRRAQPCLPRQVRRWTSQRLPSRHDPVPRPPPALAEPRAFAAWLRVLFRHDWVVYSKRPFGGPEHVLRYLGAYTHRVAISNSRLVALAEDNVTFRWRDSAHGNKKRLMTLEVEEFLRRFLLHLLPRGFVRIRNFGFIANRQRATLLPLCFQLLHASENIIASPASPPAHQPQSLWNCPVCGGTMHVVERLIAAQLLLRSPPHPEQCAA